MRFHFISKLNVYEILFQKPILRHLRLVQFKNDNLFSLSTIDVPGNKNSVENANLILSRLMFYSFIICHCSCKLNAICKEKILVLSIFVLHLVYDRHFYCF